VIADLVEQPEPPLKHRRYEIAAPMVMWAEDVTSFKEAGRKKELLVLQDECARYKVNWRLTQEPAGVTQVVDYLREAFQKHGAPLVLKHDGDAIFHDEKVQALLDQYGVLDLTSPPSYPPFNGKKERSMRDIKSYVRALCRYRVGGFLAQRIPMAMQDLNDDRPRPVLHGRTAREVFTQDRTVLPDRQRFRMEVKTRETEIIAQAGSRREIQSARRKAVIEVLSRLQAHQMARWRVNQFQGRIRDNLIGRNTDSICHEPSLPRIPSRPWPEPRCAWPELRIAFHKGEAA